jgi:hypothetical protein
MADCFIMHSGGGGGDSDYTFSFSNNGLFQYPSTVKIPSTVTSLPTNNIGGFYGHAEIEHVTFDSDSTISSLPTNCFYGCSGLKTISLPSTITSIGSGSFQADTSLETFDFSNLSTTSDITITSNAFYDCPSLSNITISGQTLVTAGSGIFQNCNSLTNQDVSTILSAHKSGVALATNLFYSCDGITSVNVDKIGEGIFGNCENLVSATVTGQPTDTLIGYVFTGCSSLTNVLLTNITKMGTYFFRDCTSLESVTIPSTVTGFAQGIFSGCISLENVIFNSVPSCGYYTVANSNNLFYDCKSLKTLALPQGWTENLLVSNGTANFTNVLTGAGLKALFESLYDYSDGTAHSLQIGSTNLSTAQNTTYTPEGSDTPISIVNIAWNKNWTLS